MTESKPTTDAGTQTPPFPMKESEAIFELSLMNAEVSKDEFEDFVVWGTNKGIPPEVLTRLKTLWDYTKKVAGEVVAVGKVIVKTIVDFMKAHPNLTVGLAIGAGITVLLGAVPVLGAVLQPVLAVVAPLYGAGVGAGLDNDESASDATAPMVAAVNLAKKFFELLMNVLQAVAGYIAPGASVPA